MYVHEFCTFVRLYVHEFIAESNYGVKLRSHFSFFDLDNIRIWFGYLNLLFLCPTISIVLQDGPLEKVNNFDKNFRLNNFERKFY